MFGAEIPTKNHCDCNFWIWESKLLTALTQVLSPSIGATILTTIDTEIKAKRNNIISELITFRVTKAKVKFGVKCLCAHECERSSAQVISIRKRKRQNIWELITL